MKSAGVAFRALIMLAFAVGIPWVALSGSSWPEMAKRLESKWQELRSAVVSTFSSAAPLRQTREAPRLESPQPRGETVSTPTPSLSKTGVVPAGYQAPADPSIADRGTVAPELSDRAAMLPAQDNTVSEALLGRTSGNADPFDAIQQRLRRLGATYYLLEAWGNEQPLYRFYCKMAIGGNARYARCFEATDGNPLEAMTLVLRQVEAWHNGGGLQTETAAPAARP